jgi:hypothetical protein
MRRRLLGLALALGHALGSAQGSAPGPAAPAEPAASAASAPTTAVPPAPAAAASRPAASAAFQGLHWGDDEAAIERRFGPRLVRAVCDAAARRAAAQQSESCDIPTLPRYEVAGIPFVLRLHLALEDRALVRVSLEHVSEGDGARADEGRWSAHHRTLRRLLTQRYGSPEATELVSDPGQPTAYARWRRENLLIELSSGFTPRAGNQPARESVRVQYQPLHGGEAGKL